MPRRARAGSFQKKAVRIGEPPAGCVRLPDVLDETPSAEDESRPPADEQVGMMARSHASFWREQTPATAQADCPRLMLAVYPLRQ